MRIFNTIALLLLIGLSIAACKQEEETPEQSAIDMSALPGEWVIETAKRGEKVAPSLNGGTFNFVDDKTVIVGINLPGITIDEPTSYKLDGENIKITSDNEIDFNIESLDAKSMVLNTKIQGFDWSFDLIRKE